MTEMYDPSNPAHVGPQVTARASTKRHLAQTIARARFFAIQHVAARAATKLAQAALDAHLKKMLTATEPAGNA